MNLNELLEKTEELAFDIEPWPQCAPADNGQVLMGFKYMTPTNSGFKAEFNIQKSFDITQAAIKYGDNEPRFVTLKLDPSKRVNPSDHLTIHYTP